jgi:hypothetical protein
VDPELLLQSMPMFEWANLMLTNVLQKQFNEVVKKLDKKFALGGYAISGLVWNFSETEFHHDKNGVLI